MLFEQNLLEQIAGSRQPAGLGGRWYGVFAAIVTDISDPDGQGRVKIKLPWSPDNAGEGYDVWARLATLMGGNNRGRPAPPIRGWWIMEWQRHSARKYG
jgi:uncharacterized protein involved in type VI secretion and phage assembly